MATSTKVDLPPAGGGRNELKLRLFQSALHRVTSFTKGLQINLRVCTTSEQRGDMIDFKCFVQHMITSGTAPFLSCCHAFFDERCYVRACIPRCPLRHRRLFVRFKEMLAVLQHTIRGTRAPVTDNNNEHDDEKHGTHQMYHFYHSEDHCSKQCSKQR